MGLDPAEQLIKQVNPRLICGRLTGFGQTSSMAKRAGHDINFVAQSGVLSVFYRIVIIN
jgi:alpha-methylacyl-CoA racemase